MSPHTLRRAVHFLKKLRGIALQQVQGVSAGDIRLIGSRATARLRRRRRSSRSTPYVYEAFLQVHELDAREEWREILASIARHACIDIKEFETSKTGERLLLHAVTIAAGSSMLPPIARSCSRARHSCFSNDGYWRIAERNLNFVLENQNADGSWYYAVDGVRDFVDHFHTCFVMKALAKIHALTGHEPTSRHSARGVKYYLANLFDADGLPRAIFPGATPDRLQARALRLR